MTSYKINTQEWSWSEKGVEVRNGRDYDFILWEKIDRIAVKHIKVEGKNKVFFAGESEDITLIRMELVKNWKKYNPKKWAKSIFQQSRVVKKFFLLYYPLFCFCFTVLPWICLLVFMYAKDAYHQETFDACIRGIFIGSFIILCLIVFYCIKIRKLLREDEEEAKLIKMS